MPLLAGISYALPQAARSCYTTTEQVIEPTSTATYLSTYVTSITATTPKDQGTFTTYVRVSSTETLGTITQTENDCTVYVPSEGFTSRPKLISLPVPPDQPPPSTQPMTTALPREAQASTLARTTTPPPIAP